MIGRDSTPGREAARRVRGRTFGALALTLSAVLLAAGCAPHPWDVRQRPGVSPEPAQAWTPPADAIPAPAREIPTPPGKPVGLAELIHYGLAHHPDTRAAWFAARSAAAAYESRKGSLYPQADLTASASRTRLTSVGGKVGVAETLYGAQLQVSYLLLDFGGRRAAIEQARQALIAADWAHNSAIADRVLAITAAYHAHQASLALASAERAVVNEASTNLTAAEERRRAGVATLADVLQAKTAASRAQLALETYEGQAAATRGALNVAVGLPASGPLTVEALPADLPLDQVSGQVDALIAQAEVRRPELGAALADARRAEAALAAARSANKPQLTASGNLGLTHFSDPSDRVDTYGLTLALNVPVFTGFTLEMNRRRAEADLEAARATLESLRQQVDLQVFESFQDVQTALQKVRTSQDLVESANKSHEVALGRYQAGAGSILELLTAQSALEDARAEEVQARTDWLIALARLARAAGSLTLAAPSAAAPSGAEEGKQP